MARYYDESWQFGTDGELHRNDRLAAQIAKQPLHNDRGVEDHSRMVVVVYALFFAGVAASIGVWWMLAHGIRLLMR